MNWDERFMALAQHVAGWSKDHSRKVGCVIVSEGSHTVLSLGYNGFPRGINDAVPERHERPAKYLWTEHAARNGVALSGQTIYLPWYPCVDCARAIIQAGLDRVVVIEPDWEDPKFGTDFKLVRAMFDEVDIWVDFMEGEAPKQQEVNV